jgi:hypothetical protein
LWLEDEAANAEEHALVAACEDVIFNSKSRMD